MRQLPLSALISVFALQLTRPAHAASAWPPAHKSSARSQPAPPPPPLGYHVEQRPVYGLIIAGSAVSVIGAALLGMAAAARAQADREQDHPDDQGEHRSTASILNAMGIIGLTVGVPMLTVGLFARKSSYVPDRPASLTVNPISTAAGAGAALTLSF